MYAAWAGTHRGDSKAEQLRRASIPSLINAKKRCISSLSTDSRRIEAMRLRIPNKPRKLGDHAEMRYHHQVVLFTKWHAISNRCDENQIVRTR